MSYYPHPLYPQPSLNPRAPTFQSYAAPSQSNMTYQSHHYQASAPEVRNGVYQYPPDYHNAPSPMYPYDPPAQHRAHPPHLQQPGYPPAHAAASYYMPPPFPQPYMQSQPQSKHEAARHHHQRHHADRKDEPPRCTTLEEAQCALPPAQRGYRPRHGDIVTTYYPKTPAQLAHEHEVQARRDGLFGPARVEPEDKTPDRRWEVRYADGDRDYLTFAQIRNGFPGGEWRAGETGQWRYHLGSGKGGRHGARVQARGWTSGSEDDGGAEKGKGKKKAGKSRRDESSADEAESSESEVTSEHIRRWRAAWDDKY